MLSDTTIPKNGKSKQWGKTETPTGFYRQHEYQSKQDVSTFAGCESRTIDWFEFQILDGCLFVDTFNSLA